MHEFTGIEQLRQHVGEHLGYSGWHEITQDQIDRFADATGDHQWIHVDPERASAGPFGRTIAHGYLTLALAPALVAQVYRVDGLRMAVNYGSNKVRFPSPTPVDSRLRAGVELVDVRETAQGFTVVRKVTMEREGADKPACVAELVAILAE